MQMYLYPETVLYHLFSYTYFHKNSNILSEYHSAILFHIYCLLLKRYLQILLQKARSLLPAYRSMNIIIHLDNDSLKLVYPIVIFPLCFIKSVYNIFLGITQISFPVFLTSHIFLEIIFQLYIESADN